MGRRSGLTHSHSPRALHAAVVLTVVLLSAVVRAESPPPLVVRLPTCDVEPFPYEDFVQHLRAQLAQDGGIDIAVSDEAGAEGGLLQVSGACAAQSAGVALEVVTTQGARLRRNVPFFDLPMDVRGRGLALVAAELVRAANSVREAGSSNAIPIRDFPSDRPVSPTAPPTNSPSHAQRPEANGPHDADSDDATGEQAPDAPAHAQQSTDTAASHLRTTEHREVYWGIAAQGRMTTPTTTIATGARAQLRVGEFVAGADWLTSSADDSLGTARGNIVAGWVGLVVWNARLPGWWIGTSPRASLGIAVADATPAAGRRGGVAREPYVDAAWQIDARWELGKAGGLSLGADAGVARGVTAASDEGPMLALGGWFVGARAGLEVAP